RPGPDGQIAVRAKDCAQPSEKKPQVVVNLGQGADGGPGIMRQTFLFYCNRRAQSLDLIDKRCIEPSGHLARVGGQGLKIAPLPFGEKGVEGERRFARAAHPGDYDKPVSRDSQVDAFEVVLARSPYVDRFVRHNLCQFRLKIEGSRAWGPSPPTPPRR